MIALLVGDTDTSIDIQIVDDEGLPVTGLVSATFPTVKYSKGAGADATISTSDLSALTDAHADGGVKERGEGVYRLDLPDAVASTAAPKVTIRGEATDKRIIAPPICVKSATRGFTGTALPAAAADAPGGLPVSDAGGLALDDRFDNLDFATSNLKLISATIGVSGNDTTHICLDTLANADDGLNDMLLLIFDFSTSTYHSRWIEDWVNSTRLATVATLPFTPEDGVDSYTVFPYRRDTMKLGPTQTTAITGNITGNLSGSVGSVTGAVGSVTGNVGGNVTGSVGSVAGAVGSVTGNVGGNVTGSVGSVVGLTASNLDATVSSRASQASADADHDLTQTGVATALAAIATTDGKVDTISSNVSSVLARLGAWAGTGINTILGAFKALFRKDASAPSDIGGTFDPATDSTEGMYDGKITDIDNRGDRVVARCTVGSASTTTSIVTSACSPSGAVADQFKGRIVVFDKATATAALRGQATDITASSNSATPTLTVTALTTAPASGDTFSIC